MNQMDSPDGEPSELAEEVAKFVMTVAEEWGIFKVLDWLTLILRKFGYA